MGRQLGQFLLDKGAIEANQLHVALEAQVRFGGRLGFNLVDLGFLSPIDLARHLGAFHGVESVEPTEVRGVRWDILNSIPRELLLRHRAIPIAMSKGRITVVMSDPSNIQALDEMSFSTGKAIQVRVAPDFVVKRALETYFGASFVELVRPHQAQAVAQLKNRVMNAQAKGGNGGVPRALEGIDDDAEIEPIPGLVIEPAKRPLDEDEWPSARSHRPALAPVQARAQAPASPPLDEAPVVVGELVDVVGRARGEIVPIHDLASACAELADLRHWADVAAVLLGFASTTFDRAALFRVGGNRLRGWKAVGAGLDDARFRGVRIPVAPGLIREALDRKGLLTRELRIDPTGVLLARTLGGSSVPRGVCVARLDVRGEPAAIFYADDGIPRSQGSSTSATVAERLQGRRRSDLEVMLRKAEVALEMVSLRRWLPHV